MEQRHVHRAEIRAASVNPIYLRERSESSYVGTVHLWIHLSCRQNLKVFDIIYLVFFDLRTELGKLVFRNLAVHHGTLERASASGRNNG
jgi:hypothetical protein